MRNPGGRSGHSEFEKQGKQNSGQSTRTPLRTKLMRMLKGQPTAPRSGTKDRRGPSVRTGDRTIKNAVSPTTKSKMSFGPKSWGSPTLAELRSPSLKILGSADSLLNDGQKTGNRSKCPIYEQDDSSRMLNTMWQGEGGDESRSRFFTALINIENYECD